MGTVVIARNPTFKTKVEIPDPEGPVTLELEFKRMKRKAFGAYFSSPEFQARSDVENIMEIVVGWDAVAPFSREAMDEFCEDFHAAGRTILGKYMSEQAQVKAGN